MAIFKRDAGNDNAYHAHGTKRQRQQLRYREYLDISQENKNNDRHHGGIYNLAQQIHVLSDGSGCCVRQGLCHVTEQGGSCHKT